MKETTLIKKGLIEKSKINPLPRGIIPIEDRIHWVEVEFDIENLEHVNFIRSVDGNNPLSSLNGYCVSTGCSCRHPNGSKGIPHCGLFKCYDADGIKKDFINQIFGI